MRRTMLLPLVGLLLMAGCAGDSAPPAAPPPEAPPTVESLSELVARAAEGAQVEAMADTLLDQLGARISALASGDSAQAWTLRQFQRFGLENAHLEPFDLLAWDRGHASLEFESPAALAGTPLNILSLGHVASYDVEATLLDAGFGTAEEIGALGESVRGKIVVVDVGSPPGYGRGVHRTEKVTLATQAGALGFIQVNNREGPLVPVGVATIGDYETEIPAVAADYATGRRLLDAIAAHSGGVSVRLRVENWMERTQAANVVGDIRGTGDEVILVGAHLDSWDLATGALDNGSGSLAVLEIARALSAHVAETGERPWRTIRFALWMGEELGLYGSRAHVEDRVASGDFDPYVATLNMDVVSEPTGLGAMGRPEAAPFLTRVNEALGLAGLDLSQEIGTGGGLYSDHQPFLLRGVPVVTIGSRHRPEAAGTGHTTADTRDVIDEAGIGRSAAVAAGLLWALANEPDLGLPRWEESAIGGHLERLGLRDPLERGGEWRWP